MQPFLLHQHTAADRQIVYVPISQEWAVVGGEYACKLAANTFCFIVLTKGDMLRSI
jgi:roadblock/LC7 domain-containing protein